MQGTHPFEVVDRLGEAAATVLELLDGLAGVDRILAKVLGVREEDDVIGWKKLLLNAEAVVSGGLVGAIANEALNPPRLRKAA